jgi:signal transduction histidine kinase
VLKLYLQGFELGAIIVLGVSTLIQIAVAFCFRKKKRYSRLLLVWSSFAFISAAYLIAISGGFKAPGYFWLFLLPIVFGIFANGKYAFFSLIPVVLVFTFFYLFNDYMTIPETFKDPDVFIKAKFINVIFFTLSICVFMYLNYNALKKSKAALETKTDQLDKLIRVMCHDLKNDIFVVEYHTDKLLGLQGENQRRLSKIKTAAQSIKAVTMKVINWSSHNVSDYSQVEAHEIIPILESSIDTFEVQMNEKDLKLKTEFEDLKLRSLVDPITLKVQIFNNIISNAIKFTPDGGFIHIYAKKSSNFIEIGVLDSGVGISDEQKKDILKIRKRGSTEGTRGEKGTGFGLPLLYQFVKDFGGKLHIDSPAKIPENKDPSLPGTAVIIKLPIA